MKHNTRRQDNRQPTTLLHLYLPMSTIASGVVCTWSRKYDMMKMVSSHCVADSFPQPDSNNWHIGFSTETLYKLTLDVFSN